MKIYTWYYLINDVFFIDIEKLIVWKYKWMNLNTKIKIYEIRVQTVRLKNYIYDTT